MNMTKSQWYVIARRAQELAQSGRLIDSIRLLRYETGCGLKEAYHAANMLRDRKEPVKEGV